MLHGWGRKLRAVWDTLTSGLFSLIEATEEPAE